MNEICNKLNINMVVDCVSSAGLYQINLEVLNKMIMFGYSSNKCIGSYPGLAIVVVKNEIIKTMSNNIGYLNIKNYYDYSKKFETPFTPCIQNLYAYKTEVENLLKRENIESEYEDKIKYLISKMSEIVFNKVLKKNQCHWVINFYCNNPDKIYDLLYSKKIFIYKCKGKLENKALQIAILNKSKEDIDFLIENITNILI